MKSSQDSDKPGRPTAAGQPDHYAEMQRDFRWQVDGCFNIAEVCCSRWARAEGDQPDATKRIATRAHQKGGEAVFHTYFVTAQVF